MDWREIYFTDWKTLAACAGAFALECAFCAGLAVILLHGASGG